MSSTETTYRNRKKHILIVGLLILFNIITTHLFLRTVDNGQPIAYDESDSLKNAIMAFLVGFPALGFTIGFLLAFIPYKKLSYIKKYLRASLLTLLTFNGIFSLMLVLIIILTLMGYYQPNQDDKIKVVEKLSKEQIIKEFENEIKVLFDSSNYYFDWGLKALNNGQDPDEISKKIRPKLILFENQIDEKSRNFSQIANEL